MKKFSTALTVCFVIFALTAMTVSASDVFLYNFSLFKGTGAQYSTQAQKLDSIDVANFGISAAGKFTNWHDGTDWIYLRIHSMNGPAISQTFRTNYATVDSIHYLSGEAYPRLVQFAAQFATDNPHYGASISLFIEP